MSILRLMIVDDHPLFRRGVRQLVDMDPGLVVVGEASDGAEAVRKAVDLAPNLILLDLNMQPMDGIEVLRRMRDARVKSRIVMLTVSDADEDVVRALKEGADGYLLKDMDPEDVLRLIRDAAHGQVVLGPQMASLLASVVKGELPSSADDGMSSLTARERDILRTLARGLSNKMIARELDIAEGTVKVHVKHLFKKLDLRSRVEAAVWATKHGLG
ncbi:two-component system response regulator NarL [Halomonas cupida]|uniref:DNA-binding response regulator n=1 Tax=Halomonas cupida TaxID=44933 RepID=A0A1M7AHZ5_9GAMM|nr:two-component system response regulator NarL [Halomonas cupida]GEN22386.1 DNA-binding response regulator [Halomonas cupida]SHL42109.1 two component transcriptional regulator, LuxR family [Halomonas cupida]